MIAEEDSVGWHAKFLEYVILDPEFVAEPRDHCFPKYLVRAGKRLHRCEQEPFELYQWFFVEDDIVEIFPTDAGFAETELDCFVGKVVIVFLSGKAFFFRGGDQLAVANERGRGIMVIAGNPQDVHQS